MHEKVCKKWTKVISEILKVENVKKWRNREKIQNDEKFFFQPLILQDWSLLATTFPMSNFFKRK